MTMIKHEKEYELYHYHESLCSQMVRLALEEKAIPWKSHPVMLNDVVLHGENFTPGYLEINPKGFVPTLVHNGMPIYDAWTIIDYLDVNNPGSGTALTPMDPDNRKKMRELIRQASLDESRSFGVSLGMAIPILSAPVIRQCIKQQPFFQFWWKYRKHPVFDRRWGARAVTLMPVPRIISRKSVNTVGKALAKIEQDLAHGEEYYLGEFCQIDIMIMAHFHRIEDVALGSLLRDPELPNIASYWERLQRRQTYAKAVTEWHEPTWRNSLEVVFGSRASPELREIRKIALNR